LLYIVTPADGALLDGNVIGSLPEQGKPIGNFLLVGHYGNSLTIMSYFLPGLQ
jgi:hypothetical protein